MRKSSVGKSPKTSPKREKMDWERPAKSQNGRFDIHLATIKKLPETPLRFTWTIHHAPKPTGLPTKSSLSPHSLTNRKPQNRWESFIFLHGPTRPQMDDSKGEKLTFWHSVWRSSFTSTTRSLCWSLLKCNTEQTSRDTTKKDRLRIYPKAVLSTLLYRYSLLV